MKRAIASVVLVLLAVAWIYAATPPAVRGIVIDSLVPGSAPERAGLKVGDELISWTRAASAVAPEARGQFHSPFDARDFELEQLPRGGVTISALRNGAPLNASLIPGFWSVETRTPFAAADLAAYNAGQSRLVEQPNEALTAWQPLIDRLAASGDAADAAWLMTRVATSLIVHNELDRGEELFERAVDLVKSPQQRRLAAMIWEAKALGYRPDDDIARSIDQSGNRRPKLVAAQNAYATAGRLWLEAPGDHRLARAECDLNIVFIAESAGKYFFSLGSAEASSIVAHYDQTRDRVLKTFAALAPQSYARARALRRMGSFTDLAYGPAGLGVIPNTAASATRLQTLRQALSILEIVAPTHPSVGQVLRGLPSHLGTVSTLGPAARAEYELIQRKLMRYAEQTGDPVLRESAASTLARSQISRGAISDVLSLRDELLRTGSTYASLQGSWTSLAVALETAGERRAAIEVLQGIVDNTSPPYADAVSQLALVYRHDNNVEAEARVLALFERQLDQPSLPSAVRIDLSDRLSRADFNRRDLGAAEHWAQQALAAAESAAPSPAELTRRYLLLWLVVSRRDPERSRDYLNLAIGQYGQTKGLTTSQLDGLRNGLLNAVTVPADRERIWAAELGLARRDDPGSLRERTALWSLAREQDAQQHLAAAQATLLEALTISQRLQPGSAILQDNLVALGQVAHGRGDRAAALKYFNDAFTLQQDRVRAIDTRQPFAVPSGPTTEQPPVDSNPSVLLIEELLAAGELAEAFDVAERTRASTLLQMLRSRNARDTASVPLELEQRQRQTEREYEAAQQALEAFPATTNTAAVNQARSRLAGLRQQLEEIHQQIAALNPAAAALERPAAVSLAEARRMLDPGTVLLSYVTGTFKTFLFVVTPVADTLPGDPGVTVHELPVSSGELQRTVTAFRTLIRWDDREPLLIRARALYDALIRPAEPEISRAQRILLNLDGWLQSLPFAALVRNQAGQPEYLAAWKTLHATPSMSVYAETLKQRRPVDPAGLLVAFGDPIYSEALGSTKAVDGDVTAFLRAGNTMTPLPGTLREVTSIARMFSPRSLTYVGNQATETRVKTLGSSPRFIHFAVHGVLNEQFPMNSALVFATPASGSAARDNGLLQAWEIFGHMHIDADLVTLSACDSALGKDVAGEGLVGLTRAFLYAGARTVAASLWKVEDGPTALLMTRFYANLRAGDSKDEALRKAQLSLIRMGRDPKTGVDYSSPVRWAAFTLTGDWK